MTEVVVQDKEVECTEHCVSWWYKRDKELYILASIGGKSVVMLGLNGEVFGEDVQVDNTYAITEEEFDAVCNYDSASFTKIYNITITINKE